MLYETYASGGTPERIGHAARSQTIPIDRQFYEQSPGLLHYDLLDVLYLDHVATRPNAKDLCQGWTGRGLRSSLDPPADARLPSRPAGYAHRPYIYGIG